MKQPTRATLVTLLLFWIPLAVCAQIPPVDPFHQSVSDRLDALESDILAIDSRVTANEAALVGISSTIAALQSALSAVGVELADLDARVTELEGRVTALETPDPLVVSSLTASAVTASSVTLDWTGNGESYQLNRDGSLIAADAAAPYIDTGLAPETGYLYDVVAVRGAETVSASITATTLSDTTGGGGGGGTVDEHVCTLPTVGRYPAFDAVVSHAHRHCAMVDQRDIDAWTHVNVGTDEATWETNPEILFDATIQAPRAWIEAGTKGISLAHEFSWPLRVDTAPTEGDRVVISYELWFDPETRAFYTEYGANGGTKLMHPRGGFGEWTSDPDGDYKDGMFKLHVYTRGKPGATVPNTDPPILWSDSGLLGGFSMQAALEYVGANTTDVEPWQPNRLPDFYIPVGEWIRVVQVWEVHYPLDQPVSTFTMYLASETRPAIQVMGEDVIDPDTGEVVGIDPLDVAYPWYATDSRGMWRLHAIVNWKETATRLHSNGYRNFVFLTNATPQDVDALTTLPVEPSGGVAP